MTLKLAEGAYQDANIRIWQSAFDVDAGAMSGWRRDLAARMPPETRTAPA